MYTEHILVAMYATTDITSNCDQCGFPLMQSSRASNPLPRFDSSSTALSLSKQALYLLACGSLCRALQLANLRKCVTTAQQTDESHFRRENTTQVWPPRAKETQTTTSSGTNPPRQVNTAMYVL
jgi:hypothetical protein